MIWNAVITGCYDFGVFFDIGLFIVKKEKKINIVYDKLKSLQVGSKSFFIKDQNFMIINVWVNNRNLRPGD